MTYFLTITIVLLASFSAFARSKDGYMRPMCEKFAATKRTSPSGVVRKPWIDVDTIRWNERYVPEFQEIVGQAKNEAVRNQTFKTSFVNTATRSYTQEEIEERNIARLQSECGSSEAQLFNCTHFKADCAMQMSNKVLTDNLRTFSDCAIDPKDHCGSSFLTPEGVKGNLAALDKAVKEIDKLKAEIDQDPGLSEYFMDVEAAYKVLHDLYDKALEAKKVSDINFANLKADSEAMNKLSAGVLSDFDRKANEKYNKLAASDAGFKKAVDVLNKCDDYLDQKGYSDRHQVISQINICQIEVAPASAPEIAQFTDIMDHLEEQNNKENLKNVAVKALENSIGLTVTEFANLFKAMTGRAPTQTDMCSKLDAKFCQNPLAKSALKGLGDLPNVPKMNSRAELQAFNKAAEEMNKLCLKAPNTPDKRILEGPVQAQLTEIMYNTRIGQLMGFEKFRKKIPPFNQEECLKGKPGFKLIPNSDAGVKLVEDATWGVLELQKDKSKQIKDYLNQVAYTGKYVGPNDADYEKLLRNLLENDPFTVREAIRSSGSPDQALWLCHATSDIYRREKNERVWKWIGTGLCIAGSLAATVFTFGAATPLLVGSIAMGAGMGVYNLNQAWTKQHNTSMSAAINSSDAIINSNALTAADEAEKGAYVEIALSLLPVGTKYLKVGGALLSKTPMVSKVLAGVSASKLGTAGNSLLKAVKSGQKFSKELVVKALGEKLASSKGMKIARDFLVGASDDAALEFSVAIALHPDPLSEESIRMMLQGMATGQLMRLGSKGMLWSKQKAMANFEAAKIKNGQSLAQTNPTVPQENIGLVVSNSSNKNAPTVQNDVANPVVTNTSPPNKIETAQNSGKVVSPPQTTKINRSPTKEAPNNAPVVERETIKISRKDFAKPSDFKKYLEGLKLNKGDVIEFPGGHKFTIEKRLGGESMTEVYLLADGNVLRINKKSEKGFGSVQSFRDGHTILTEKGVPVAKIVSGADSPDFVVVQKIDSGIGPDQPPVSFEDFINGKKTLGPDKEKYYKEFEEFAKRTKDFETLEDFRPDQVLYDKDRGWVLADYGVENRSFDGNGKMTVFDQNWDDLDPSRLSKYKEIVIQERKVPPQATSKHNAGLVLKQTETNPTTFQNSNQGKNPVVEGVGNTKSNVKPIVTFAKPKVKPETAGKQVRNLADEKNMILEVAKPKHSAKDQAYFDYMDQHPFKVSITPDKKYISGKERLAELRGTSVRDVEYQLSNKQLEAPHGGGEADLYFNPKNKNEAIKIWNPAKQNTFESSVKTMLVTQKRISQNPILNKYMTVSKIKEKGQNYIIKDFNHNSTELKHVLGQKDVQETIEKLKIELVKNPDTFNQKLLQTMTRKPPSGNLHWDPNTKQILIIDALGF